MKRNYFLPLLVVLTVLFFAGCTPGGNPTGDVPSPAGDIAGFWLGLWHGIIVIVTFVISLFTDNVEIYEVYNNGGWYNFGFLLGLSISLGGSGRSSSKLRRKKD